MLPSALKNLLGSEKAFVGGILAIAATVFVALNRMTISQWQEFVTWIFGIYATGKTATSIATVLKKPPAPVVTETIPTETPTVQ